MLKGILNKEGYSLLLLEKKLKRVLLLLKRV